VQAIIPYSDTLHTGYAIFKVIKVIDEAGRYIVFAHQNPVKQADCKEGDAAGCAVCTFHSVELKRRLT
jgi:hypothetical protein